MKKRLRRFKRFVLLILAGAVAMAIAVRLLADQAVRVVIETAGTQALDVGVELDRARLSLLRGSLGLQELKVDNPQGYEHETLLSLDRGDVQVEPRSLLGEQVHVTNIRLDGINLVLEQKGTSNNLRDIIDSVPRGEESSGKRVVVDNLEITNVTVGVKLLPVPGQIDTVAFKLSPIRMTDLGKNKPLDMAALTGQILMAIAGGIAEQGADVLPKEMVSGLSSVLNTAFDLGKIILRNGQGDSVLQKGTEELGRGITEGLKDLIDQRDDE